MHGGLQTQQNWQNQQDWLAELAELSKKCNSATVRKPPPTLRKPTNVECLPWWQCSCLLWVDKVDKLSISPPRTANGCLHVANIYICFLYRFFTSGFKTAEPLLHGQRACGGVESVTKIMAHHSLSPSFSAMKTQKLAPSPCLSSQKSRWPK